MPIRVECAPAFNYARSSHTTEIIIDTSVASSTPSSPQGCHYKALFTSEEADLTLDLRYIAEATFENIATPTVELHELDLSKKGHKGKGVWTEIVLREGQAVTFVLRTPPDVNLPPQAQPTLQTAQELGIPYESEALRAICHVANRLTAPLSELVAGASNLRPPEDPILTKVRQFAHYVYQIR